MWPRARILAALTRAEESPKPVLQPPYTLAPGNVLNATCCGPGASWDVDVYFIRANEVGTAHELRISYPATFPADFYQDVFTAGCFVRFLGRDAGSLAAPTTGELQLASHVQLVAAKATGVALPDKHLPTLVPYDMVLDRLYFGAVPHSSLRLIAFLVALIILSAKFAVPWVAARIEAILDAPDAGNRPKTD
ncbi:hypothetical protein DFJ74DRAFT_353389 [Hyaloraphidium curvatum]|nr:hypothetical protein DFJ74DRAFT_353389 [Hyaloraphidium curvatum]